MDELLSRLLQRTERLVQLVEDAASDPDEWMVELDEREQLINQVQLILQSGSTLTESHKQQMALMHDINIRLLPLMDSRKQNIKTKLGSIQQQKNAQLFYNKVGPSGYGAFFDKKN